MTDRRLVLYTKPSVPGRVKTRLVGGLTPAEASEVHRAFLEDVGERLEAAARRGDFELWSAWALEPGEDLPRGPGRAVPQEGDGLGERLFRGLSRAATADGGAVAVAALGSDHPTVRDRVVREAFARVEAGADAVLGPSADGGYYLIALAPHAVRREVFSGIDWSTERVLAQTLDRLRTLGLTVELLEEGRDVDTPEDLRRLARELAADPETAALCPRTRRLLASWDRLPESAGSTGLAQSAERVEP